jgi:phage virion morphogenesis protein
MTGVTYKFDASEVIEGLRKLLERGSSLAPALRSFGETLLSSHRERFSQQVSPDGKAWAPLSSAYRAEKRRNADKILTLDGYLRGTLRYQADDTSLQFGTDRIYAAVQQFGAKRGELGTTRRGAPIPWGDIPARPFIGLSDADSEAGMRILRDYLAGS